MGVTERAFVLLNLKFIRHLLHNLDSNISQFPEMWDNLFYLDYIRGCSWHTQNTLLKIRKSDVRDNQPFRRCGFFFEQRGWILFLLVEPLAEFITTAQHDRGASWYP